MEAATLYRLMEEPSLLGKDTLPALKQLAERYPWFQAAGMLYLKNLAVVDDSSFASELKRVVIHISDRKKLFAFIEGEKYGMETEKVQAAVEEVKSSFDLIDSFLSTRPDAASEEKASDTALRFTTTATSDYLHWKIDKETHKESVKETGQPEDTPKLQHHDLIDSFIQEDARRTPGTGIKTDEEKEYADAFPDVPPIHEPHAVISDDDSYFTETLARIYIKQKRYEKALQIIKRLSLKYPEKNVYFADQIRFLEKLIINNNK